MSKRSIQETNIENSVSEFHYDDSGDQLRKKIKLENQKIVDKIKEINESIGISEHEVHKFLLMFHILAETINSHKSNEEADGFVTDATVQIVNIIAGLLKTNIDTLNLPTTLKSALKKLKSLLIQNREKEKANPGEPETENAENS